MPIGLQRATEAWGGVLRVSRACRAEKQRTRRARCWASRLRGEPVLALCQPVISALDGERYSGCLTSMEDPRLVAEVEQLDQLLQLRRQCVEAELLL